MKFAALLAAAGLALGAALPARAEDPSEAEVARIMAVLTDMKCQMDEDEIEKTADGFELDDVYCEDGQFDIKLDADLNVTSKTAE